MIGDTRCLLQALFCILHSASCATAMSSIQTPGSGGLLKGLADKRSSSFRTYPLAKEVCRKEIGLRNQSLQPRVRSILCSKGDGPSVVPRPSPLPAILAPSGRLLRGLQGRRTAAQESSVADPPGRRLGSVRANWANRTGRGARGVGTFRRSTEWLETPACAAPKGRHPSADLYSAGAGQPNARHPIDLS